MSLAQGRLLLGTVQLGLPYGAANVTGQPSLEDARQLLLAARAAGVTHLDTARAYGDSEAAIGAAGVDLGVVTKVAPLQDGEGADAVLASWTASRAALGDLRIEALLVHRAADWHRPGVRDALAALDTLVGVSLSTPAELVEVLEDPLCGYVQLPFNLLDRRWLAPDVQAALAARPDVVVAARSAYLQGLLVAGLDARWPAGTDVVPIMERVDGLVSRLGRSSRADLCLAYVLGHSWVTSVVVGAETAAQITETAELVRQTPLNEDESAQVRSRLKAGALDLVDPSRWEL